ncbi:DNA polymerase III subunit gamma/tau [Lewinellaceae bacterium SD302]|nr:DNA polymerase III subunit gamma/tau [Lewinellaceae bacterium SD302]
MSNFVVSARKYRPVRFDEVVGQQHVSQTLKNALQTDHLAHAFLFCGPRGVGKTTNARILAKVLNCEDRTEDFEPCNTCGSCDSFNNNASLNITELDAASNNSVEHIRALIEQVRFQPQQGQYKVFIIDEVHMLSQQAFNAFLKTLEEPPSYAIFILATTEKHKIIPTILSRCQIFDFKRIQVQDMVKHLEGICEEEGITADPDALHIIAQKADGALRDSLSIFDRITSFSGKEITYEGVIENLNVLDYDYFFRATDMLLTEDRAGIMLLFDEVLRKGFDADLFINGLAGHLRNLLVCKEKATLDLLETGQRLRERYHQQSAITPVDMILTALNLINDCDLNYKMARNQRLHVEMTLLKLVSIRRAFSLTELPVGAVEKKTADLSAEAIAPSFSLPPNAEISEPIVPGGRPAPPEATPEVTEVAAKEAVSPPQNIAAGPIPQSAGTEEQSPESTTPTTSPSAEELAKTTSTATTTAATASSPLAMPGLSLGAVDPAAMLEQFKAETSSSPDIEIELPELTPEALQEHWATFQNGHAAATLREMMKLARPELRDDEVIVKVGSQRTASMLRADDSLIKYLRDQFKRPNLSMRQEEDASMNDIKPTIKKRLTAKDKYLAMRAKNPALDDLRKRFDLRPEE